MSLKEYIKQIDESVTDDKVISQGVVKYQKLTSALKVMENRLAKNIQNQKANIEWAIKQRDVNSLEATLDGFENMVADLNDFLSKTNAWR